MSSEFDLHQQTKVRLLSTATACCTVEKLHPPNTFTIVE